MATKKTPRKTPPKVHITVTKETYAFLEKLAATGHFGGKKVTPVATFLMNQQIQLASAAFGD